MRTFDILSMQLNKSAGTFIKRPHLSTVNF
ncbi:hypothetical protein ABIB42_005082 [Massilia sp. UYP32]